MKQVTFGQQVYTIQELPICVLEKVVPQIFEVTTYQPTSKEYNSIVSDVVKQALVASDAVTEEEWPKVRATLKQLYTAFAAVCEVAGMEADSTEGEHSPLPKAPENTNHQTSGE